MYYDHEEIIARSLGVNHRWNFKQIRGMKNPITGKRVERVLHRRNVKDEDITGATEVPGESNEYVTQYDNGLMVRELSETDDNPYIAKQADGN